MKKFFGDGQLNGSTKYFYSKDHLGSIREMADNSGVIQSEYSFDSFGRRQAIAEAVVADFGYAAYYSHVRSTLNLTGYRAYTANLARWISRDPIEEGGGVDLFAYVDNDPIRLIDPSGLSFMGGDGTSITGGGNSGSSGSSGTSSSGASGSGAGTSSTAGTSSSSGSGGGAGCGQPMAGCCSGGSGSKADADAKAFRESKGWFCVPRSQSNLGPNQAPEQQLRDTPKRNGTGFCFDL